MKIGVTGGSGNVGTYVCRELAEAGHDVVSLDLVPPKVDVAFTKADLCDHELAAKVIDGFDRVVHLAAIPHPYNDPPDRVMSVNMVSSLAVFEAAKANGIPRVVYACSESSTGFGIHTVSLKPLYVPVDEEHPCWPHETYSLSKHFGERIGANYAKAFGLEVVSLRYTWVLFGSDREAWTPLFEAGLRGEFEKGRWFGAYITAKDVARAVLAATQCTLAADPPFEAFLLTARDTVHPVPTMDALEAVYGEPPDVRDPAYFEANPYASVFDIRKAERLMGWTPVHHWRDHETWDL